MDIFLLYYCISFSQFLIELNMKTILYNFLWKVLKIEMYFIFLIFNTHICNKQLFKWYECSGIFFALGFLKSEFSIITFGPFCTYLLNSSDLELKNKHQFFNYNLNYSINLEFVQFLFSVPSFYYCIVKIIILIYTML